MNSILHQWKWDFRRIRTLWLLWIVILIASGLGSTQAAGGPGADSGLSALATTAKYISVYLFGILLVARIMFTTPFAGTRAFWKTRPLKHSSIFWGKTLAIAVLIFLPVLCVQVVGWQLQNLGGRFLFWAALQFGSLTFAMFFLAAVWAALCKHFGTFSMCFVGTGALLAAFVVILHRLSSLVGSPPLLLGPPEVTATNAASTSLSMVLAILIGVTVAWLFGVRLRNNRTALFAILAGVTVSAGANHVWRTDFLRPLVRIEVPEVTLDLTVLDSGQSPGDDQQLLFSQLAVKLPEKQVAHPQSWHGSFFPVEGAATHHSDSADWSSYARASLIAQRLLSFYPEGTRMLGNQRHGYSCIQHAGAIGKPGQTRGEADVMVYEWRRVASLPLDSKAAHKQETGGTIRIGSIRGNRLEIVSVTAPRPFSEELPEQTEFWRGRDRRLTPVIYHEASGTAATAEYRGYGLRGAGSFTAGVRSTSVELDNAKWLRLTKLKSLEENRDSLRLDVYQAIPVGRAKVSWDRKDWAAYFSRDLPSVELPAVAKPAIAKVPLPKNPTPEQVDAYLDGVLFSLSSNMSREDYRRAEAEIKALGPEHVDRLLARMPVGSYAESIVYRALPSIVTEEQKPAVLEALARDSGLVVLIHQKGWQAEAAAVITHRLKEHRQLDYKSSPLSIRIVAAQADPSTYGDLRWHFVRSENGIDEMAKALAQCPGFPLEESLAEMWTEERYHLGSKRTQLAPLVARLGDKEALRLAFVHYATKQNERDLEALSAAVAHSGGELLPSWIHENFEALTFNQETRKFELK